MKAWITRMAAVVLTASGVVWAASTDDEYVDIYNQIQQADDFVRTGRITQARQRYEAARTALLELQKREPTWNPRVVEFRLRYITDKLSALPAAPAAVPTNAPARSATAPATETASALAALQERVRQLEADKLVLTARLREALAGQPAAVDPRELAKAEEKIKSQQKEIEQLRADRERAGAESSEPADALSLESSQRALAQARQELATQAGKLATLALEKEGLQARLRSSTRPEEAQALREENARLKARFEELSSAGANATVTDELRQRLVALQTELSQEQTRAELLRAEKRVLEQRLTELHALREADLDAQTRQLREELAIARKETASLTDTNQALLLALAEARRTSVGPGAPPAADVSALERERDELRRQFDAVSRELMNRQMDDRTAEFARLTNELASLKARLNTLEAGPAPYSREELALFKSPKSPPPKSASKRPRPSKTDRAVVSNAWTASSERGAGPPSAGAAGESPATGPRVAPRVITDLADQAARELGQSRWDRAEAILNQALAAVPDDPTCLGLLGRLRYEQERMEDALEALSRSAQLDPRNAETFNYLGLTLGRKGLREPAKSALRRAVLLAPGYGSAHHNLAAVYATQQPPALELARHHYQKARAAGEPSDPQLEALLATPGSGSPTP